MFLATYIGHYDFRVRKQLMDVPTSDAVGNKLWAKCAQPKNNLWDEDGKAKSETETPDPEFGLVLKMIAKRREDRPTISEVNDRLQSIGWAEAELLSQMLPHPCNQETGHFIIEGVGVVKKFSSRSTSHHDPTRNI